MEKIITLTFPFLPLKCNSSSKRKTINVWNRLLFFLNKRCSMAIDYNASFLLLVPCKILTLHRNLSPAKTITCGIFLLQSSVFVNFYMKFNFRTWQAVTFKVSDSFMVGIPILFFFCCVGQPDWVYLQHTALFLSMDLSEPAVSVSFEFVKDGVFYGGQRVSTLNVI